MANLSEVGRLAPEQDLPYENCASINELDDRRWYAAYTRPNHERIALTHLTQRSFESWLPTYETVRQWKDRRVRMRFPLFPSYVFVRAALRERIRALEVPGVVRLVGFGGLPTPLSDADMFAVRNAMECPSRRVEPCKNMSRGTRVRVISGPFEGLEGSVTRKKGDLRVVILLELIKSSFMVEVSQSEIRLASSVKHPHPGGGA